MASPREDLLGLGVARLLPGADYSLPGDRYARLEYLLEPAAVPGPSSPLVLVDLETLGFMGRPLFLIGALYAGGETAAPRLVQYLARDYSEEAAVVGEFLAEAGSVPTWVTFNGRTFDLPVLKLRAAYHGLAPIPPVRHLDLLPLARRRWAGELPDCRLRTLETRVCQRWRGSDIGGARIPDAYHAFVRTGEPWEMLQILRHNAADLESLLALLPHVCAEGD